MTETDWWVSFPGATLFGFIGGLLFGSFLNVCIYRIPRDLSVVMPRSFCPECGRHIAWYDNLPVLSFLLLRGKCRYCRQKIGYRYPLAELITAGAFAAVIHSYGLSLVAAKWLVFEAFMIALFWTDLEERILPDEFTLGGSLLGALWAAFVTVPGIVGDVFLTNAGAVTQSFANLAAGAILMTVPVWLLGFLYAKFRKREGLGLGDVKLLLLLGIFLGPENGLFVLMIGATGGALIGGAHILLHRKDALSYEIPFGSFLCAAGFSLPLFSHLGVTISRH